jgi:AraC-like DNA-binding protein
MFESAVAFERPIAPSSELQTGLAPVFALPAMPACIVSSNLGSEGDAAVAWNLGEMIILRHSGAQPVDRRTAEMARADQMDHYRIVVSFAREGATVILDDTPVPLVNGEPLLLDLARAATIQFSGGAAVQAFVPREMLDELLNAPRELHGLRLVGASATVLAMHLRSLATCLPEMTEAQAPFAVTATLHMVVAALASTPELPQAMRPRIESPLLRQACRYIELHLGEPTLAAADVCAAMKVSRATLYRVFEPYGGISAHIRERRLARIHEVLCEGRDRRPLARIAEDHGFENSAHFSRAFRQQYGHCPRDAARLNAADRAPAAAVDESHHANPLTRWLRALRC